MADSSKDNQMKAVIFAGGVGTRMWPLSREATPKQFEKILDGKSTLQLTVSRLYPDFTPEDIYISTGERYVDLIRQQLPEIPPGNIIGEPVMKDVGPAVGYVMAILSQKFPRNPVAILWSDHLLKNVTEFKKALKAGSNHLASNPDQIVFLGQKARFASQNLGWIEYGKDIHEQDGLKVREFISWHYRPDLSTAERYLKSGHHAWNPGYFIVTPDFVLKEFKKHSPEMFDKLMALRGTFGKPDHQEHLSQTYPTFEKISFDILIVEKIRPDQAVVISVDLGWADLGAWEALKEALQEAPESNVTYGSVKTRGTTDSLVYSYTNQLVATIDMDGAVVVVTPDVILVTKKESIPEVKKLVEELKAGDMAKYT